MKYADMFIKSEEFTVYNAGEIIVNIGDPGNEQMFAVKEGEVEISAESGAVLETVEAGMIFGEMALIDGLPRASRCVAKTDCKIVTIDKHRFLYLVHETPTFALEVMKVLADRVRYLNSQM
ncbi:MAG: Crp/Fnr family transcriptional regulator [Anaerolineales bacterium]